MEKLLSNYSLVCLARARPADGVLRERNKQVYVLFACFASHIFERARMASAMSAESAMPAFIPRKYAARVFSCVWRDCIDLHFGPSL